MSRYFSTEKSMIMLNIILSFPYNSIIYKRQQSLEDTFYTLIFLLLIPQHLWPLNFKAQFSHDVTQPATIFSPSLKVHVFTRISNTFSASSTFTCLSSYLLIPVLSTFWNVIKLSFNNTFFYQNAQDPFYLSHIVISLQPFWGKRYWEKRCWNLI